MTLDIYGRQLPAPFAFFDPESSAWRTSRPTLLSDSTPCSLTLPAWGMTRGGALYELRTPELLTSEPACSSLLPTPLTDPASHNGHARNLADEVRLLPTPRTTDANGAGTHGSGGLDLRTAIQLLPTPTASDAKGCSSARPRRPGQAPTGDTLTDAVTILVGDRMRLLPTPRATRGGSSTETMYALGGELSTDHRTQGEVLLPTPTAGDAKDSRNSTVQREPGSQAHPGDTLTDAVTILVGDRTRQRSDDGKPSSAA